MDEKKLIDLSELLDGVAKSPSGRAKMDEQARVIRVLQDTLVETYKKQTPYEIPAPVEDNTIKFAVIGDTHIGSLYHREDAMEKFFNVCRSEGYPLVLHAGDVVAGWKIYKGQEFELHPYAKSWPEQLKMFTDEAQHSKDCQVIFITGNHDNSFKKLVGIVPGEEFAKSAPNWKFIGQDIGDIVLSVPAGEKFRVRLIHPGGGTAYALSYHLQKIIESLSGGQKPNMIVCGHYHKSMHVPQYRNVAGLYPGCFESQTPFMIQRGISASIGGWLIKITLGKKSGLSNRVQAEWIGFFEDQKK